MSKPNVLTREATSEQPQCPKCKSKVILYRKRTDDYLCRRCGEIFKKEDRNGK